MEENRTLTVINHYAKLCLVKCTDCKLGFLLFSAVVGQVPLSNLWQYGVQKKKKSTPILYDLNILLPKGLKLKDILLHRFDSKTINLTMNEFEIEVKDL